MSRRYLLDSDPAFCRQVLHGGPPRDSFRPRTRGGSFTVGSTVGRAEPRRARHTFTVIFYGSTIFGCKTAQLSETLRESVCSGLTSENRLRNSAKICAKALS
jgi:hypothetical protein